MTERRPLVQIAGEVKELPSGDTLPGGGGGGTPDRSCFGAGGSNVTITAGDTLSEDREYENLTLETGAILYLKGCILRVADTLTITDGAIDVSGGNGSDGVSGGGYGAADDVIAIQASNPHFGNFGGNHGTSGGGVGTNGSSETLMNAQLVFHDPGSGYCTGGSGGTGDGGGSESGAGGSRASYYRYPRHYGYLLSDPRMINLQIMGLGGSSELKSAAGGTGGGGGGGTNGGFGGGGGAGGGVITIFARNIVVSTSGYIRANGGNGGNGQDGGDEGGGGGGGAGGAGGLIVLVYESLTGDGASSNITANAGTGGSGGGGGPDMGSGGGNSGSNGENGAPGIIIKFNKATGAFE